MKFVDENHQRAYVEAVTKYKVKPGNTEVAAVLYLLTASRDCRCRLEDLVHYSSTGLSINSEALHSKWLTGGSERLLRLAFNLFTGVAPSAMTWDTREEKYNIDTDEVMNYLPLTIFSGLDPDLFEAGLEALRLHRGRVCSHDEEYIADVNERLFMQKYGVVL